MRGTKLKPFNADQGIHIACKVAWAALATMSF